jgi:hypothetical protein
MLPTSTQEAWRLDEDEVELVASSYFRSDAILSVISIVSYYGAPVSGRFEDDFLDIWAAADDSFNPRSVTLYGCGTMSEDPNRPIWRDLGEFAKSRTVNIKGRAVGLYRFSGSPVDEFVVRLTDHQGNHHYDNNGGYGANYHLRRYHEFQLNCVRATTQKRGDWILLFPKIVGIRGAGGVATVGLEDW